MNPQPLVGDERDEILKMVSRIRQADTRLQKPRVDKPLVAEADLRWAEDMQLPTAFFEFFTLDRAA